MAYVAQEADGIRAVDEEVAQHYAQVQAAVEGRGAEPLVG